MRRAKRSAEPNRNERDTTTESVTLRVRRFVVFRRYEAIETWFVEAPTAEAARERVFPDDPAANAYFAERGGAKPIDSAVTRELKTKLDAQLLPEYPWVSQPTHAGEEDGA